MTALMVASWHGETQMVEMLVKAGSDIDLQSNDRVICSTTLDRSHLFVNLRYCCSVLQYGHTALWFASLEGHSEAAQALLRLGAKINVPSKVSINCFLFF